MHGFVFSRLGAVAGGLALAAGLAACGPRVDGTAAAEIVVFLNAARTDDRTVFEAHVDRAAARDDLRAQLADLPGVKELQAQLGEGMGEGALDRLISPETVRRLEKAQEGSAASSLQQVRPRLRSKAKGRVCLRDLEVKDRCLMTFAKVEGSWKLVGLYAERQSFDPPAPAAAAEAPQEAD